MNTMKHAHPCPVGAVGHLDNWLRRRIHPPEALFLRWVQPGSRCVDIGCGGGFATMGLARMAGPGGRVVAADLQPEMLELVRDRAVREGHPQVETVTCSGQSPGLEGSFDFALMMYVAHEVEALETFLAEVRDALTPGGVLYLAEPRLIVNGRRFEATVDLAKHVGLVELARPRVALSRACVLERSS